MGLKPWQFSEEGEFPCRQSDPDAWFPKRPKQLTPEELTAKSLCGKCPFQTDCLDYALRNDVDGIWGGTTETDRALLRSRLGIKATPMSHLGLVPTHKGKS